MAKELISAAEQMISFGDYTLTAKAKLDDYDIEGDLYTLRTYKEITKLEKNGLLVYESVPGTAVTMFKENEDGAQFCVEGPEDAQITLGLDPDAEYDIIVNDADAGTMKTNLGGKLSMSVELAGNETVRVQVIRK